MFETLGVACSDIDSDGRLSDCIFVGRRSTGVEEDSWRSVNDRADDVTEEERSVRDLADAFERDRE